MSEDAFFAKGKRSKVYLTCYEGKKAVRKIAGPKFVDNLRNEAYWLVVLNKNRIGPKLFCFGNDFIVMEFVQGLRILDFFDTSGKKNILGIIKGVLLQCKKLDSLGVNKEELTNPYKHIIVRKNKPVMIDFERCRNTESPKNVTQFVQFLTSRRVSSLLEKKKIKVDVKKFRSAAKRYKASHNLQEILSLVHSL